MSILRATFQHLPGIGATSEAVLWTRGITDWEDLERSNSLPGVAPERLERFRGELRRSRSALEDGNAEYFARNLPPSEHWRLYSSFPKRTAFLDIETTGLSPHQGIVTCVTVHGGGKTRTLVYGEDLEELGALLRPFALLVTFNGRGFDVPFLEVHQPELRFPPAHADLRWLLLRLGQKGGLKIIERRLGLGDRTGVEGVDGLEAVRLWESHRRGVKGALERLVEYNRKDTQNLEPLMEYATREMERRLLHKHRPEVLPQATSEARLAPVARYLAGGP
ncbi:MAG: ribonuclease H-like domain-containing protein [Euryarchaeota archaeon]|nr:ribonuclease H-like domain-containing protein [Euryarchaeota archaeon]MDE1879748.1 ribonuclease H-like domain-containing protein [Euryarchaeota archaeon]